LSGTEIRPLLHGLPDPGIAGGSTYDALIAACARKARADAILTWNVADFERVTDGIEVTSPRA
jgi:predicted nucleic acid-binding protein